MKSAVLTLLTIFTFSLTHSTKADDFLKLPLGIKMGTTKFHEVENKATVVAHHKTENYNERKKPKIAHMLDGKFKIYVTGGGMIEKLIFTHHTLENSKLPKSWSATGLRILNKTYTPHKLVSSGSSVEEVIKILKTGGIKDVKPVIKRKSHEDSTTITIVIGTAEYKFYFSHQRKPTTYNGNGKFLGSHLEYISVSEAY